MGQYRWHVTITGRNPAKIRHYNWITKLYLFILRNPSIFRDNQLTIYKNDKALIDVDYGIVAARKRLGLKEGAERKEIIRIAEAIKRSSE